MIDESPTRRTRLRRVCLVIGGLGLGGAEKQLVLLAEGLSRRGIEVLVVVLDRTGPRGNALRTAGVPVVELHLPHLSDWWRLPRLVMGCRRFAALLRQFRPDVVHAFLFHSYVLAAPIVRCRMRLP